MNRLVVQYRYANGAACDFSGYWNHGLPFDATDTPAPDAPGFTYASLQGMILNAAGIWTGRRTWRASYRQAPGTPRVFL